MRRPDFLTVVKFLIAVRVTLRTRSEGTGCRPKLRAPMLSMAINATNPRGLMRLDYRRRECLSAMTRSTSLLHVA